MKRYLLKISMLSWRSIMLRLCNWTEGITDILFYWYYICGCQGHVNGTPPKYVSLSKSCFYGKEKDNLEWKLLQLIYVVWDSVIKYLFSLGMTMQCGWRNRTQLVLFTLAPFIGFNHFFIQQVGMEVEPWSHLCMHTAQRKHWLQCRRLQNSPIWLLCALVKTIAMESSNKVDSLP